MIGREKQRGRMDRDLADGFGAESRAHDKHFSTPAVQCLRLNPPLRPMFSLIKIMFFISQMVSEFYFFFAYLNQTIFCGCNFVDFSCLVQFTHLYLSLKDN